MSTDMISPRVSPGMPPGRIARFSVEQYHRMVASGAFAEDDRIELLAGWVVEKMTKNPRHAIVTGNLHDQLTKVLPAGWHVRNQDPITLADSEPEPDLAIVRGERNDHPDRHPSGSEVALVIEVADTSISDDRWKARIYAAAGIPEYWIVNILQQVVEVYRPSPTNRFVYDRPRILNATQVLHLNLDNDVDLNCTLLDLLPPSL